MSVTVVHLRGPVDLAAGRAALDRMSDTELAALAPEGLLGWGWQMPGEAEVTVPWEADTDLAGLDAGAAVSSALVPRFAAAARTSIARCLENAARLLGGEVRWFETRVATRVPVSGGGYLVLCAEDVARGSDDCAACDIVRLPADILPAVGAAMGIHGLSSLELSVAVRSGD